MPERGEFGGFMPVGAMVGFGGATVPVGWLFCYGQAVSRTTYAELFRILSTTWGTGDGSTTFNLPDYRGRVIVGDDDMGGSAASRVTGGATLSATGGHEGIPEHTHTLAYSVGGTGDSLTGTEYMLWQNTAVADAAYNLQGTTTAPDIGRVGLTGNASSTNNMPPYAISNIIIYTGVVLTS